MANPIPVVLFAFARPDHLVRVLDCLRENEVPLILAFADGAKSDGSNTAEVAAVRSLLRAVDWTELRLVERDGNMGLGPNILTGVTAVAEVHEKFIVWEDDLICVPGTYMWMCAALERYADDAKVMSVSAWTHPRVTPAGVGADGYFDRRADCWVWGAYARSWRGMTDETASEKMKASRLQGWRPGDYGADLPIMAREENDRKTWAPRWLYHHFEHDGLCLRPSHSLVEHIGFDATATNAAGAVAWRNAALPERAEPPTIWPEAEEHPDCRALWQSTCPRESFGQKIKRRLRARLPEAWTERIQRGRGLPGYYGHYADFAEARAASGGYEADTILEKVVAATRAVRDGQAAWERDTVLFDTPEVNAPLLAALRMAEAEAGGLHVLDFGGALGSTWWQHREVLGAVSEMSWNVVEQATLVEVGQREFSVGPLNFFHNTEACVAVTGVNVVLLSGVLAYVPDPYAVLAELAESGADWLILDRTGFTRDGGDRLTVQQVSPEIYAASYPCWFLDRGRVVATLGEGWKLRNEWVTFDESGSWFEFRGMVFQRESVGEGQST